MWNANSIIKNYFDKIRSDSLVALIKVVSVIYIIVILLIFGALYANGLNKVAYLGLGIFGVPTILVCLLIIYKEKLFEKGDRIKFSPNSIKYINIIIYFYFIIYTISIIISNYDRAYIYYILIASLILILVLDLEFSKINVQYEKIFLIKLFLLFSNFSVGYTLKYPVIIFGTDVFYHMSFIANILHTGHLDSTLGAYQHWPLFHIYYSVIFLLTSIENWQIYYVSSTFIYSTSIISVYLFSKYLSNNVKYSLFSALMYIFIPSVIFDGMYTIAKTFAYLFLVNLLVILLRDKRDLRFTLLSVFIILPFTLTHHLTLLMFICILLIIVATDKAISKSNKISVNYINLLILSFIGYLVYIAGILFDSWLKILVSIKEPVMIGSGSSTESEMFREIGEIIFSNMGYSIMIFISFVGFVSYIIRNTASTNIYSSVVLASAFLIPFQVPEISNIFSSVLGYRIPSIIAPFIAFISAFGSQHIMEYWGSKHKYRKYYYFIFIIVIITLCTHSLLLTGKQLDPETLPGIPGKYRSNYFSNSELNSFDFCDKYVSNKYQVYSDYFVYRYMESLLKIKTSCSIDGPKFITDNTYTLIRDRELDSFGTLFFLEEYAEGRGFADSIMADVSYKDKYFTEIWSQQNKIYDNLVSYVLKS